MSFRDHWVPQRFADFKAKQPSIPSFLNARTKKAMSSGLLTGSIVITRGTDSTAVIGEVLPFPVAEISKLFSLVAGLNRWSILIQNLQDVKWVNEFHQD